MALIPFLNTSPAQKNQQVQTTSKITSGPNKGAIEKKPPVKYTSDSGQKISKEEMQKQNEAIAKANRWTVEARAKTYGIETIQAKQTIKCSGIGKFTNTYYVKEASHEYNNGSYIVILELKSVDPNASYIRSNTSGKKSSSTDKEKGSTGTVNSVTTIEGIGSKDSGNVGTTVVSE